MPRRHHDGLNQGRRDLEHARHSLEDGDYEWACFAAQQGAEKAVKAIFLHLGAEAWGHAVFALLESLPEEVRPEEPLLEVAKELDKHYIPSRYPNALPQGAPYQLYTRGEAERALHHAEQIIAYCQSLLSR